MSPLRGGAEWAALKPKSTFTLRALIGGEDERTDYLYSVTIETVPRVQLFSEILVRIRKSFSRSFETRLFYTDELSPDSPSVIARLYNEKRGLKKEFRRSGTVLSQLVGLTLQKDVLIGVETVAQALQGIFILDPIPAKMRSYSPLSDKLQSDASNIAGVLAALPESIRVKVEQDLSKYLSDLPEKDIERVWAEKVGRFETDAMLYCREAWVPEELPTEIDARAMSDGTLRFLAILTALLTRPEGSQMVIEEVDNGLHPSRSNLLLKVLRDLGERRKIDILVTTHNPALLDELGTEMLPFIVVVHRDPETGESKLTLLEDIRNLPKLLAAGPIGKLSSTGLIERNISEKAS
jgi:hypothetical protein